MSVHTDSPKRQKLLIIITKSNFGGAQRYVYELATRLDQNRYEITVVCGGNGILVEKLQAAQIRTITLPALGRDVSPIKDAAVFFQLYKLYRAERPDIIHLNSSKIGGLGAVAGRLARVPKIIFTAHAWAFNENRSTLSKIIIGLLHWTTIIFTTKTISVSAETARQISVFPFIKHKITVIYNGTPESTFLSEPDARTKLIEQFPQLEQVKSASWIGTLAELHPIKGLDLLITAFGEILKQHPNYALLVCGEGQERAKLEQQIATAGLTNKIFLLGFIADAKQYLKALSIFTMPSRSEAFPGVILEAGLAERPVIASRVGGVPEIIEDKKHGLLIPKENIPALVTALETLITNPDQAQNYARTLKHKIETSYTMEKMIEQTTEIYTIS